MSKSTDERNDLVKRLSAAAVAFFASLSIATAGCAPKSTTITSNQIQATTDNKDVEVNLQELWEQYKILVKSKFASAINVEPDQLEMVEVELCSDDCSWSDGSFVKKKDRYLKGVIVTRDEQKEFWYLDSNSKLVCKKDKYHFPESTFPLSDTMLTLTTPTTMAYLEYDPFLELSDKIDDIIKFDEPDYNGRSEARSRINTAGIPTGPVCTLSSSIAKALKHYFDCPCEAVLLSYLNTCARYIWVGNNHYIDSFKLPESEKLFLNLSSDESFRNSLKKQKELADYYKNHPDNAMNDYRDQILNLIAEAFNCSKNAVELVDIFPGHFDYGKGFRVNGKLYIQEPLRYTGDAIKEDESMQLERIEKYAECHGLDIEMVTSDVIMPIKYFFHLLDSHTSFDGLTNLESLLRYKRELESHTWVFNNGCIDFIKTDNQNYNQTTFKLSNSQMNCPCEDSPEL